MIVHVHLRGCDDSMTFSVECDEAGYKLLRQVALKSRETSEYGCQPNMKVKIDGAALWDDGEDYP